MWLLIHFVNDGGRRKERRIAKAVLRAILIDSAIVVMIVNGTCQCSNTKAHEHLMRRYIYMVIHNAVSGEQQSHHLCDDSENRSYASVPTQRRMNT